MPASRIGLGVVKSGSPMPREITSFMVAAISKNLRMPEGFSPATRFDRRCTLVISCIEPPLLLSLRGRQPEAISSVLLGIASSGHDPPRNDRLDWLHYPFIGQFPIRHLES